MTSIVLSKRLKKIAEYCPAGSRVADIGSDHALLTSYLLASGLAAFVIAGELNEGPYQAAREQVAKLTAADRASVRKGDGLAVLAPGEVNAVCIAGMGGQLISSILESGKAKLPGVQRLILQPNVGEEAVRRWLLDNRWQLIAEDILEEDGVIYEILVAEPGDPLAPYREKARSLEELLRLGPWLWEEKSPILRQKWEREREKLKAILAQLAKSRRPETKERYEQVVKELDWIEEVIRCLQTGKPSFNT
ncbi:tRNA (adenine(22)-N(1))-methyltransferase [Brevibacillus sp. B_LB10_24]|uniref:tRNA (adenine(22)-N(1))-methyltransferase n=1 Tax=Brevibacillus sp. B_LB10_24 TaxID=3380645 RepID=UPI0038B7DC26